MDVVDVVTGTTGHGFLPVAESSRQQLGRYRLASLDAVEDRRG
jgi:hypothetical protein